MEARIGFKLAAILGLSRYNTGQALPNLFIETALIFYYGSHQFKFYFLYVFHKDKSQESGESG